MNFYVYLSDLPLRLNNPPPILSSYHHRLISAEARASSQRPFKVSSGSGFG
ncbi:Hypothetical protein ABZS17G119_03275 [Kosakonia cowanii]